MNKVIRVTKYVPQQATILLVNLSEAKINEILGGCDHDSYRIIKKRVDKRLAQMKGVLKSLKEKGHRIIGSSNSGSVYQGFEEFISEETPPWNAGLMLDQMNTDDAVAYTVLDDLVLKRLQREASVLVCGLWLETDVYVATRLLQAKGIQAFASIDPALSFDNGMMWLTDDVLTLEKRCHEDGVLLINVDEQLDLVG